MFFARSPMRSRSLASRRAPTTSRRSTAIGWRLAMMSTALSSISRWRASIFASADDTRCASAVSRFASASTESATCFSARPPISATMRERSCRSVSKAFIVWSDIVIFRLSKFGASTFPAYRSHALAKASCNVVLRATIVRGGEDAGGLTKLDQLAEVHEGREIGYACGLLHVVGHDGDRVVVLEFVDQLFDLCRGDRVQRRAGLVEQNYFGSHRNGTCYAQPLLLTAGQRKPVCAELVLDLVPKCGALECVPDSVFEFRFRQPLIKANPEGDILEDRHRKRSRLLEHHSDFRAQEVEILRGRQNIRAIERHVTRRALVRIKVVHAVQDPQQR